MAEVGTEHRIVESIEIKGHKDAQAGFNKLANTSDKVAKALGHASGEADQLSFGFAKTEKVAKKVGDATKGAASKASGGFGGASGVMKKFAGSMLGALTIAGLLEKVITGVVQKIGQLVQEGWGINVAFEAAQSRIQGTLMGLVDFGKGVSNVDKIRKSQRATNAIMAEFRDIGMDTATQIPAIEDAYTRLNTVLAGTGRSQKDILKFTRLSTGAAKVYGERASQAGSIVAKAIYEGTVEGETAFARALKAQAGVTSKMKLEDRIKKVTKVLEQMAAPVGIVTKDTAGALERWKILSDDILQRVTLPVYKKIGEWVGRIVAYAEANKEVLDAIVTDAQEYWHVVINVAEAAWEITMGLAWILDQTLGLRKQFKFIYERTKLIWKVIDLIATAWRGLITLIEVASGDEKGFGKLLAYSKAIELKWKEIQKQILKVVNAFVKMVLPDWAQKRIPGFQRFQEGLRDVEKGLESDIDNLGKHLRRLEKAEGLGALTETTRAMARAEEGVGLDKAARDALLAGLKGLKITQNIGKVEVHQDLRDTDPDRILVEFVTELERLGENSLQSTVAGEMTAFEAGSSF